MNTIRIEAENQALQDSEIWDFCPVCVNMLQVRKKFFSYGYSKQIKQHEDRCCVITNCYV